MDLLNDRYQLDELLGKGGMAMVYRGRDLMLERDVAIKILREDYSKDPAFHERFRQEAKAAANLSHNNIVTVHDFGLDGNKLFIVMEYNPGTDLNSMIQKQGRFNIEEGLDLIIQACAGLGYAHRAGLVHCDVKPHNFLVTPDRRLKVTDFGIARALASITPDEESEVIWGSPQYFAPEQAGGLPPSPASDVYSLGVVIYLMFTGQLPFIAKTSGELAALHRRAKAIPPRELNPFIPPALEEIILKVLAKEPAARYRTADQLGRVLMRFGTDTKAELPEVDSSNVERISGQYSPYVASSVAGARGEVEATPQPTEITQLTLQMDWLALGLGLLAVLSVGGLIPFWLWVYFQLNPPVR